MSNLTDILSLLTDNWAMAPLLLAVMCLFAGVVTVNKDSWERFGTRIRNPRNARRFMLAAFMAGLYCLLWYFCAQPGNLWLFILLGVFIAAFFGTCLGSLVPVKLSHFRNTWLRRREHCLKDGTAAGQLSFATAKRPWYLFSRREQVEFRLFACQCHCETGDMHSAYEVLCEINEGWLYENERSLVRLQKSMPLLQMGNMRAADMLLGQLVGPECDTMVWFGLAYNAESAGDMDTAFELMCKAKARIDLGNAAPGQPPKCLRTTPDTYAYEGGVTRAWPGCGLLGSK